MFEKQKRPPKVTFFAELPHWQLLPVATATATTAETIVAARSARLEGLGLVHGELAPAEIVTIPHLDSLLRVIIGRHLDETEAA